LRALHIVALIASVAGTVIVSKPESLVSSAHVASADTPWLGYGCSLAAGILAGASFIAARKSKFEKRNYR